MDFSKLQKFLSDNGAPDYRFKQIVDRLDTANSFEEIQTLSKQLRQSLSDSVPFVSWTKSSVFTSADGTLKATLTFIDGKVIETVLMQPFPDHWSVCVSCEVGCAMNCAFCATGNMGFHRQLSAEEIADQIFFWQHYCRKDNRRVDSVVFMGMGEPFHNREAVFTALHWIHSYYGIGYRHISISTCGIIDGIKSLAATFPQVNLAISLHSAIPKVRLGLMPITKAYDLNVLAESISQYVKETNRQVMFEYLLIQDLNDTQDAALALVNWLKQFPLRLVHINLIRYNETGRGFVSPSKNRVRWFMEYLIQAGVSVSIRKSLGLDIAGACGQLATQRTAAL